MQGAFNDTTTPQAQDLLRFPNKKRYLCADGRTALVGRHVHTHAPTQMRRISHPTTTTLASVTPAMPYTGEGKKGTKELKNK